jgi:hypothetical protein
MGTDESGNVNAGVALSATSTTSRAVQILILNDAGTTIGTDAITLPGRGHTSFVLGTRYPATGNVAAPSSFNRPQEPKSASPVSALWPAAHTRPSRRLELKPRTFPLPGTGRGRTQSTRKPDLPVRIRWPHRDVLNRRCAGSGRESRRRVYGSSREPFPRLRADPKSAYCKSDFR